MAVVVAYFSFVSKRKSHLQNALTVYSNSIERALKKLSKIYRPWGLMECAHPFGAKNFAALALSGQTKSE